MTSSSTWAPLLLAAFIAGPGSLAWAAAPAHDHGHAPAAKAPAAGQRWATDAALREGMTGMRRALQPQLKAIHDGRLTPAQYAALAADVDRQVTHIVTHCKLPPDADAALHGILADVAQATQALQGKSRLSRRDGAVKLARALDDYGRTFDHPGWQPLHD